MTSSAHHEHQAVLEILCRCGALAFALIFILNPEIRALLMLADAMGLEAVFLMVIAQLRNYWPVLRVVLKPITLASCRLSSGIGELSIRAFQLALPIRPFAGLLGRVFIALSYGLRCPIGKLNAERG